MDTASFMRNMPSGTALVGMEADRHAGRAGRAGRQAGRYTCTAHRQVAIEGAAL